MPVLASAQSFIEADETTPLGRIVTTKPAILIADNNIYGIQFVYTKINDAEVYAVDVTFYAEKSMWEIEPNTLGLFTMTSGESIILETYTASRYNRTSAGLYNISALFLIPEDKLSPMLDALIRLTIITKSKTFEVPIDYDNASILMLSYLELLSKTGK